MLIRDESIDVPNINEFKNLKIPYRRVNLLGRYSPGDNQGGEYFFDAKSTPEPNDITVALNNIDGRYERITTNLANLVSTSEEIDYLVQADISYGCYVSQPNMTLTTSFQKVTTWSECITPIGITESSGTFTSEFSGIYNFTLERVYLNFDNAPSDIITLYIEMRRNGDIEFERNAVIGAATKVTEPATNSYTTPFIISASAGDEFEFRVRAIDDGGNPIDTRLSVIQFTANKIHNLPQ